MVALVIALGGCAGPSAATGATTTPRAVEVQDGAAARAEERQARDRQREHIRELEAALGLARAEVRDLRAELREREAAEQTQATHIGETRCEPDVVASTAAEPPEPARDDRPVLRLYGQPALAAIPGPPAPPMAAAPPPPSIRLPVMTTPGADPQAGVPAIPAAPVAVAVPAPAPSRPPAPRPAASEQASDSSGDEATRAYRAALAHLASRHLDEALAGLDAFLEAHPQHPYADNALYWRAEIHYARRDYRRALAELTALVERYPRGNKVPEALLRIGLCHERMGDRERARQVFQRLRSQFPDSVAARMASREDV